jgi:hypothetical protein
LATKAADNSVQEKTVAIRDCVSNVARFDNTEDWEDDTDTATEQGELKDNNEPCWVIGIIFKIVHQCIERIRQKHMIVEEFYTIKVAGHSRLLE